MSTNVFPHAGHDRRWTTPSGPRERPIIFSGPLVRAILDGAKTVTRRVVKPQPAPSHGLQPMWGTSPDGVAFGTPYLWREVGADYPDGDDDDRRCPFGVPGDRLWLRETFFDFDAGEPPPATAAGVEERIEYRATPWLHEFAHAEECGPWRPSIYMPRWASRLTLEITGVRVERLKAMTEADVVAEGYTKRGVWWDAGVAWEGDGLDTTALGAFRLSWNALNHERGYGWDTDPWVWVITFQRVSEQGA